MVLLFRRRGLMLAALLLLKELEPRGLDGLGGLFEGFAKAIGGILFLQVAQNVEVHVHVDVDVLRIGSSILVDGSVNLDVLWAASLADD